MDIATIPEKDITTIDELVDSRAMAEVKAAIVSAKTSSGLLRQIDDNARDLNLDDEDEFKKWVTLAKTASSLIMANSAGNKIAIQVNAGATKEDSFGNSAQYRGVVDGDAQ